MRLVSCFALMPNEASEPQVAEVNGTGMLGWLSSYFRSIAPDRRWKRLISPQGVRQEPKSAASLSLARASAARRSGGVNFVWMKLITVARAGRERPEDSRTISLVRYNYRGFGPHFGGQFRALQT